MGKNTRANKERSRLQELKYENEKLRNEIRKLENENRQLTRQNSKARREIARMDLDKHAYVQEIIQERMGDNKVEQSAQDMVKSMKEEWRCHQCNEGHLEISLYTRRDGTHYHRVCNNCPNRTKMQKYDPETVKGIMRKPGKSGEKKNKS